MAWQRARLVAMLGASLFWAALGLPPRAFAQDEPIPQPEGDIDVQTFDETLNPYGQWVDTGEGPNDGRAWRPDPDVVDRRGLLPHEAEERRERARTERVSEEARREAALAPGVGELLAEGPEHEPAEEQRERVLLEERPGDEPPELAAFDRDRLERRDVEEQPVRPAPHARHEHEDEEEPDGRGDAPAEGEEAREVDVAARHLQGVGRDVDGVDPRAELAAALRPLPRPRRRDCRPASRATISE